MSSARLRVSLLALSLSIVTACGDGEPAGDAPPCGVLEAVLASDALEGNDAQGALDNFGFSESPGSVLVTPPEDTVCGREMAQRLEDLCPVCENLGTQGCVEQLIALFDISKTPVPSCDSCGDGVCGISEKDLSAPEIYICPEDCLGGCGDGVCDEWEQYECAPDDDECWQCPMDCLAP